jgi:hypothetical protein
MSAIRTAERKVEDLQVGDRVAAVKDANGEIISALFITNVKPQGARTQIAFLTQDGNDGAVIETMHEVPGATYVEVLV